MEVNLGRVGIVLQGTYDETTEYKRLDGVYANNRTYVSKKDGNKGISVLNTEYWQEMLNNEAAETAANEALEKAETAEQEASETLKKAQDLIDNLNTTTGVNVVQEMGDSEVAVMSQKAVTDLVKDIAMVSPNYYVTGYTEGDLSPIPVDERGDASIISDAYDFVLIDHTDNAGEYTTPVGTLNPNNLLRFDDGTFAPTIGITEAQRAECDVELYLDAEGKKIYCKEGTFDAETFYNEYGVSQKLYNAAGEEVRLLRPWETTETKYSIGKANRVPLYPLDNVKGKSGKVWVGIFNEPTTFDGIDVSSYKLAPTAISPSAVGLVGGAVRCFFFAYKAGDANSQGGLGQDGVCSMFKEDRFYPWVDSCNQVSLMQKVRSNNTDATSPVPFAEGGYHTLNTFILAMEAKNKTKYLHNASLFGSGISSNDSGRSESLWKANGGVRIRVKGTSDWTYRNWSDTNKISTTAGGSAANMSTLLNNHYPKEQVMESQMAYSYAIETGVAENTEFDFYGSTYWYQKVSGAEEGRMNVRLYKLMAGEVNAFDSTGTATTYEAEAVLRMSLMEGVGLTGGIWRYCGGGAELISVANPITQGSVGQPTFLYLQPDQSKWEYVTDTTHNDGSKFSMEDSYIFQGQYSELGNVWSALRRSYAPFNLQKGGGVTTGQCYYTEGMNYWGNSVLNARVRRALRFGGYANYNFCAARSLYATNTASHSLRIHGGLAQVLIRPKASAAASQTQP